MNNDDPRFSLIRDISKFIAQMSFPSIQQSNNNSFKSNLYDFILNKLRGGRNDLVIYENRVIPNNMESTRKFFKVADMIITYLMGGFSSNQQNNYNRIKNIIYSSFSYKLLRSSNIPVIYDFNQKNPNYSHLYDFNGTNNPKFKIDFGILRNNNNNISGPVVDFHIFSNWIQKDYEYIRKLELPYRKWIENQVDYLKNFTEPFKRFCVWNITNGSSFINGLLRNILGVKQFSEKKNVTVTDALYQAVGTNLNNRNLNNIKNKDYIIIIKNILLRIAHYINNLRKNNNEEWIQEKFFNECRVSFNQTTYYPLKTLKYKMNIIIHKFENENYNPMTDQYWREWKDDEKEALLHLIYYIIKETNKIIMGAPRPQGPIKLYKWIYDMDGEKIINMETQLQFNSTTYIPHTNLDFWSQQVNNNNNNRGCCLLELNLKQNTPCLIISPISSWSYQNEVLLPIGVTFSQQYSEQKPKIKKIKNSYMTDDRESLDTYVTNLFLSKPKRRYAFNGYDKNPYNDKEIEYMYNNKDGKYSKLIYKGSFDIESNLILDLHNQNDDNVLRDKKLIEHAKVSNKIGYYYMGGISINGLQLHVNDVNMVIKTVSFKYILPDNNYESLEEKEYKYSENKKKQKETFQMWANHYKIHNCYYGFFKTVHEIETYVKGNFKGHIGSHYGHYDLEGKANQLLEYQEYDSDNNTCKFCGRKNLNPDQKISKFFIW